MPTLHSIGLALHTAFEILKHYLNAITDLIPKILETLETLAEIVTASAAVITAASELVDVRMPRYLLDGLYANWFGSLSCQNCLVLGLKGTTGKNGRGVAGGNGGRVERKTGGIYG